MRWELGGHLSVVGDEQNREPAPPQRQQERHNFVAGGAVEVAGGLVGEKQNGLVDQGARDGDALALAARELARTVPRPLSQTHLFQGGQGTPGGTLAAALIEPGQRHVVQRGLVWQ